MKELAYLRHLQHLDLTDTKVTDSVLDELVGLKQLEDLGLEGTAVTAAGKRRLQTILPRLK